MANISSLCVYCGSKMPTDDAHKSAARALGTQLGEAGIT